MIQYPNLSKQMLVNVGCMPCGYYQASFAFNSLKSQGFKVKERLFNGFLLEKIKESGNVIQAEIKHVKKTYWKN
jgi:hypothetical protein